MNKEKISLVIPGIFVHIFGLTMHSRTRYGVFIAKKKDTSVQYWRNASFDAKRERPRLKAFPHICPVTTFGAILSLWYREDKRYL